jgi:hypothetical protein
MGASGERQRCQQRKRNSPHRFLLYRWRSSNRCQAIVAALVEFRKLDLVRPPPEIYTADDLYKSDRSAVSQGAFVALGM